jgi:hypothetical protein
MKQVRMSDITNKQLNEISDTRKAKMHAYRNKQDVIEDLIAKAHKRECKA